MSDSISVEGIIYTLRYHPEGGYGDEYTFICTLIKIGDIGYIQGAMGKFTPSIWRKIRNACVKLGLTEVHFERKINGKNRVKVIRK